MCATIFIISVNVPQTFIGSGDVQDFILNSRNVRKQSKTKPRVVLNCEIYTSNGTLENTINEEDKNVKSTWPGFQFPVLRCARQFRDMQTVHVGNSGQYVFLISDQLYFARVARTFQDVRPFQGFTYSEHVLHLSISTQTLKCNDYTGDNDGIKYFQQLKFSLPLFLIRPLFGNRNICCRRLIFMLHNKVELLLEMLLMLITIRCVGNFCEKMYRTL